MDRKRRACRLSPHRSLRPGKILYLVLLPLWVGLCHPDGPGGVPGSVFCSALQPTPPFFVFLRAGPHRCGGPPTPPFPALFFLMIRLPPSSALFPYTTLFRSGRFRRSASACADQQQ